MAEATRILVVDDDAAQRNLIRACIESAEVSIEEASSGKAAIQKLQENDFDAVLLDLSMPNGRGDTVVQWVLSTKPHLRHRIAILSGDPTLVERNALLSRAGIPFLAKPYSRAELVAIVSGLLAREPSDSLPGEGPGR